MSGSTADQPPARRQLHGLRQRSRLALGRPDALVFAIDVHACAHCGGRLRLIATLDTFESTRRILRHLGLPHGGAPADARPCAAESRRLV